MHLGSDYLQAIVSKMGLGEIRLGRVRMFVQVSLKSEN